jgi:(S)-ureidoglycine aminohydrolase
MRLSYNNPAGHTRSSLQPDHLLQTPDTFVRAPLPGMNSATAIVHAAPPMGARFTQYTVELEPGGSFETTQAQTFLYIIEGAITVGVDRQRFEGAEFLYLPPNSSRHVFAAQSARVALIEKPFAPLNDVEPPLFCGAERDVAGAPLNDDDAIEVRKLVPERIEFDFAVNTMTFAPGAQLPMVEIHVMEHGLLMLEGEGVYRLGDRWYNVTAGDFIWMAPYCPQWFGALGKKPAKYLIYKDWNRHPA